MAGFAILYEPDSSADERENDFSKLLQLTAHYKFLELPLNQVLVRNCTAAKLNSASSIHNFIARDEKTGSWLLAAGTVVALDGNNDPLKQLDILLKNYLEHSIDALNAIDGHFALAIYDGRTDNLIIISDPTGQFSIFHGKKGHKIFVSTSALAIARLINSPPDDLAIENFLYTGNILGERTLWRDVKRVLPARVLKYDSTKIDQSEYWVPSISEEVTKLAFSDALDCAVDLLKSTFREILQREGKVWTDLTGGLDSRLTNMIMDKAGLPFISNCVGPADHPDVRISNIVSQKMGWEYQHIQMPDNWAELQFKWFETALYKGDAYLSVPALATVLFGQHEKSEMHKVAVTGLGADEWRAASFASTFFFNWGKEYKYDRLLDANIFSAVPSSLFRLNRERLLREEWKAYLAKISSRYTTYPNFIKGNLMFIRYRYPSHVGAYLSAASGVLRSISPFCFKAIVNFGVSLDYKWRLPYHYHFVRSLLTRGNIDLANIEIARGGPALPIQLSNIHRFWPFWEPIIRRRINKVSRVLFGHSIKLGKEQHLYTSYPLLSWRTALIDYYQKEELLNPYKMNSGALYNGNVIQDLASRAGTNPFSYSDLLDRVITVEMALRATDSVVE